MSLLAASLATADGIDPAEQSGFWIDEGIIPPAEEVLRHVGREVLQNDEIPIENTGTLISLALRGRVRIDTPHGYLRVTLVGEDLREYLVAEYYPLLMVGRALTLDGVCRETCLMDAVTPHRLRVTLAGAALELETIEGRRAPPVIPPDWSARRERIRAAQAEAIVARLNDGIRARGLRWHAGVTGFSQLSFEERKARARNHVVPVLHGLEYYAGGVFTSADDDAAMPGIRKDGGGALQLVDHFDWRSRHGANRPGSPYYDGHTDGSGWMTPVTRQICSDCWVHAAVGTVEALVNLSLNFHRDLNLSEQYLLSCTGGVNDCSWGYIADALEFVAEAGLVSEACFPYEGRDASCSACCDDPAELATVGRIVPVPVGRDETAIKRALIRHGPLTFGINDHIVWLGHYMVLVGYERDGVDGGTIWILKNSWGTGSNEWGVNGYVRLKTSIDNVYDVYALDDVALWVAQTRVGPRCRDADRDGYAAWGLADEPPAGCHTTAGMADCDDSDPRAGPADASGACLEIRPALTPEPVDSDDGSDEPGDGGDDGAPAVSSGGGGGGAFDAVLVALLLFGSAVVRGNRDDGGARGRR